ncbi:hypothetical protein AB4084_35580, partial [Lysobacter sp. 2RAB21]
MAIWVGIVALGWFRGGEWAVVGVPGRDVGDLTGSGRDVVSPLRLLLPLVVALIRLALPCLASVSVF